MPDPIKVGSRFNWILASTNDLFFIIKFICCPSWFKVTQSNMIKYTNIETLCKYYNLPGRLRLLRCSQGHLARFFWGISRLSCLILYLNGFNFVWLILLYSGSRLFLMESLLNFSIHIYYIEGQAWFAGNGVAKLKHFFSDIFRSKFNPI